MKHKDTEGRSYLKTEEIGVMLPPTREHLEPPEAARGRKGFFSRAFRRSIAHGHLDFRLVTSGTVRK